MAQYHRVLWTLPSFLYQIMPRFWPVADGLLDNRVIFITTISTIHWHYVSEGEIENEVDISFIARLHLTCATLLWSPAFRPSMLDGHVYLAFPHYTHSLTLSNCARRKVTRNTSETEHDKVSHYNREWIRASTFYSYLPLWYSILFTIFVYAIQRITKTTVTEVSMLPNVVEQYSSSLPISRAFDARIVLDSSIVEREQRQLVVPDNTRTVGPSVISPQWTPVQLSTSPQANSPRNPTASLPFLPVYLDPESPSSFPPVNPYKYRARAEK